MSELHAISEQHSVKEAVITFTLVPQMMEHSKYEALLKNGGELSMEYHKYEPVFVQEINVNANLNQTQVKDIRKRGFKIIGFDSGKVSNIIQSIPQPNQTLLTFNTVNYQGWTKYLNKSIVAAKAIAKVDPSIQLIALGVMFIDEFYFNDSNRYMPEEIFNINSTILPKDIFKSDLTDYSLSNHKKNSEYDYMDNISLQVFNDFENDRKIIRITGNINSFINKISFQEALNSQELIKYLDFAHNQNKEMLRNILSYDALRMIGL